MKVAYMLYSINATTVYSEVLSLEPNSDPFVCLIV